MVLTLLFKVGRPWPVSLVMTLEDFSSRSQLCIETACQKQHGS